MKWLLAVLALALALASLAIPAYAADQVQLSWHDSGYDLAAGYRYSIGLDSGRVWTGATALAAVSAGPLRIELRNTHLKVIVNDNTVFDEDVGERHITLNIAVDCDGSGSIELSGYGHLGGFSIDHSYRIMVYTETVSAWPQSVTSRVTISRQSLGCSNPTITPIQENPAEQANYNPLFASIAAALGNAAGLALVVLLVGAVAIMLVIALKQARKHRLL